MQNNGFFAVVYGLLYLWSAGATWLALEVALPEFSEIGAMFLWGGGGMLFLILFLLRPVLFSYSCDLSPRERLVVFLFHVAAFFSPHFFVSSPPAILYFAALNVPLALMSHSPGQWRRLLLNCNLIIMIILGAYDLSFMWRCAILASVALLWPPTAVADHFASTLDSLQERAAGMTVDFLMVTARMTLLIALTAAPVVAVTIFLDPAPVTFQMSSFSSDQGADERIAVRRRPPAPVDIAALMRNSIVLVVLLIGALILLRYLRKFFYKGGSAPLIDGSDQDVSAYTIVKDESLRWRKSAPLEGEKKDVVSLFETLCQAMRLFEFGRKPHQTAREYLAALRALPLAQKDLKKVSHVFEEARYGSGEISATELKEYRASIEEIRSSGAKVYAARMNEEKEDGNGKLGS